MFNQILETYKNSSSWERLTQGSKNSYKKPLARIQAMARALVFENGMQLPVARSRSHIEFWDREISKAQLSNSEKNKCVAMVKLVYRFSGLGHMVEAVAFYKHERAEAHPLSKEVVDKMMSSCPENLKLWANRLVFGFWTGFRPSEVRSLRWSDVGETYITVLGGKGRESGVASRKVKILPEVKACLDFAREISSKCFVFVSENGCPLNKNIECVKVREVFDFMGLPKATTLYDARRGLATEMCKRKFGLIEIGNQLGHKDISTTQRYVRLTMEEKAEAFNGF